MKPLDTGLGRVIHDAREKRGLTQEELAHRCGISRRHLIGIEQGGNFTVSVLVALVAELVEIAPVLAECIQRSGSERALRPSQDAHTAAGPGRASR